MPPSHIPLRVRLAYSLGHFQNDLMASMWFSYLLIYFHEVRKFNNIYAGTLLLAGQVADAIATPLIGYEADATNGFCGYTKRKSWHLIGLVCTTCSFPFIFSPVIGASPDTPDYALFIYYVAFVILFQIGWASVQISHLSLIPELTSDESEVAGLNGWRYAATGVANLATYAIAWVILGSSESADSDLSSADETNFRNIGLIVTGTGVVTSVLFHLGVPEPKHNETVQVPAPSSQSYCSIANQPDQTDYSIEQSTLEKSRRRNIVEWFKDVKFYQVALIYMCTRLFVNISQVFLPMYLTETLELDKETIANVPLTCFASSFVTATVLKFVDKKLGRARTYLFGLLLTAGSSVFVHFIPAHTLWMVYLVASMIGIGGALILITSLSFVADLIGDFTGSSAFVYGSMSFTDKLANGVAVEMIQVFHPCTGVCCPACKPFYRKVLTFVPGGASATALLGLCTLACSAVSNRTPGVKVMTNPTAARRGNDVERASHQADYNSQPAANGYLAANGNLPSNQSKHSSPSYAVAEVHGDPSSLNDGQILHQSDSDDEEDAPLLRPGSGRHSATQQIQRITR